MDYRKMFKGDYIAAVEFEGREPTFTIKAVAIVRLASLGPVEGESAKGGAKERDRGVISFAETDRGWVLNRTNAECLVAMWGAETDAWIGKRVTLHALPVKVGGKDDLGIRIKGSPDLTAPVHAVVKLPRKRPVTMVLQPTGRPAPTRTGAPARNGRPAPATVQPQRDPLTGEVVPPPAVA